MEHLQHAPETDSSDTPEIPRTLDRELQDCVTRYASFMRFFNPYAFAFVASNGERDTLEKAHPQVAQLCNAFWLASCADEKMRIAGEAARMLAAPLVLWVRHASAGMDAEEQRLLMQVVRRAAACAPQRLCDIVRAVLETTPHDDTGNGNNTGS